MLLRSQPYFTKVTETGERLISWRVWVLIWVAPVLFVLAGAGLLGEAGYRHVASTPTEGEVVRVYAWDGTTWFDSGKVNYSPVFRYIWSDGQPTEASSGMSHPDWNHEIGSRHPIRYFTGRKANIVIPGPQNWYAGLIVGAIGLVLTVPAIVASLALWRWQAKEKRE